MLKRISILVVCLLGVLMLSGCGLPDGSFVSMTGEIYKKTQNLDERARHEANYYIRSIRSDRNVTFYTTLLVLPENFGNTGDVIQFTNNIMYAAPR
jgi:hypothetical protein